VSTARVLLLQASYYPSMTNAHKTNKVWTEHPEKPSFKHGNLLLTFHTSHAELPPMMKARTIPMVITAMTGNITQTIMNMPIHQIFPIAISSTH